MATVFGNGVCKRQAQFAISLTDNWDAEVYEEWRPTMENFDGVYFEAYLMNGAKLTRIEM